MENFLFVTHNGRFLVQFELNDIRLLQSMGYEVHCATNFKGETMRTDAEQTLKDIGVICHQIDIERSPFKMYANMRAFSQLEKLMQEYHFSGVHCHTPMGGVIGRLAAQRMGIKPVLYTAHGFHFYKGCPLKNRVIYQTAETFLARFTDAQITINQEDYAAAKKFPLRGKAYYIPGIGVDVEKISGVHVDRAKKRQELGISPDAPVYMTVGELIPRKNQNTLLRAFAQANLPDARLVICGSGRAEDDLRREMQELKLENRVVLAGFRTDIYELLQMADVFVFPSLQEGLPVALMEAMAAGLPCVASRIRSNIDLLGTEYPYLVNPKDAMTMATAMQDIWRNRQQVGLECSQKITAFDLQAVQAEMVAFYQDQKWGGVERILKSQTLRRTLGISLSAFVFISVGELNQNKNHQAVIHALAKANMQNAVYLICGEGKEKTALQALAERLGIAKQVYFLGFRSDVTDLLKASDCFVFPSHREGLSVSLMEAMAAGLPCIATCIRGNVDLLPGSQYLFDDKDTNALCRLLQNAAQGVDIEQEKRKNSLIIQELAKSVVEEKMKRIYKESLENNMERAMI